MATVGIGLTMAPDGRGSLTRRLLAVGRVAGRRGESGGVRFGSLMLATLMLSIGLVSLVGVHAGYAGVWERFQARDIVSAGKGPDPQSVVDMKLTVDELDDGRSFDVVFVDPGARAPVAPGIEAWPGPGEVLMSPALLDDGAGEGIRTRYGELVGTIDREGLTDPVERFAYVGARERFDGGDKGVVRAVDFGVRHDEWGAGWLPRR